MSFLLCIQVDANQSALSCPRAHPCLDHKAIGGRRGRVSSEQYGWSHTRAPHISSGGYSDRGDAVSVARSLVFAELLMHCQRRSLSKQSKGVRTTRQDTKFTDAQTALLRRIQRFRLDQDLHMPQVAAIIKPEDSPSISSHSTRSPESITLYMPSDIKRDIRPTYCEPTLIEMEADIRLACCADAVQELRRLLHLRVYLNKLKVKNITGQRANTRARLMQATVDEKVVAAADTYRKSRAAYVSLKGAEGAWTRRYRVLEDRDVVGLGERVQTEIQKLEEERLRVRGRVDIPVTSGESRRKISCLWYSGGLEDEQAQIDSMDSALTSDINDGELNFVYHSFYGCTLTENAQAFAWSGSKPGLEHSGGRRRSVSFWRRWIGRWKRFHTCLTGGQDYPGGSSAKRYCERDLRRTKLSTRICTAGFVFCLRCYGWATASPPPSFLLAILFSTSTPCSCMY